MTKKTLQLLASVAVIAGLGLANVVTASAADATPSTQGTTANIELTGDDDEEGTSGGILLKQAPTINFDKTEMNGEKQVIEGSIEDKITVVNPGRDTGWNIVVSSSGMKRADAATNLLGSTYTISADALTNDNAVEGVESSVASKIASDPVFATSLTFDTESTPNQTVGNAAANGGLGTWNQTYKDATLNLSGGNIVGVYNDNLTWSLMNTPV